VRETRPDVVVVDERMFRNDAWTASVAGARLVVMGVDDDPAYPARARRIGAEAWVPKDRADTLLPAVLRRACAVK
jgi:DNA-binding NarL/FixJ family response regulator